MFRPATPLVLWVLFALGFAASANATPFFARAYGFKCQVCHSGFPRLNEFGLAFKANNFRIPGAEKSAPLAWQKTIPLAVQVKPVISHFSPGGVTGQGTDTQLLAGGLLSKGTAFFAHHTYFFDGIPGTFPSWELWVQQVLDERHKIMLKAGQFELPLSYSTEINRTTISYPLLVFAGIGSNDVLLGAPMSGLQMSGLVHGGMRWTVAGGAPAYNQGGALNGEHTFIGRFRDVFVRLATGDPARQAGLFGYFTNPPRDPADPTSGDHAARYGFDGILHWRGFQVQGMAVYGENSDPLGTGKKGTMNGAFLEADRMIKPWVGVTVRLEVLGTGAGSSRSYSDAKTISLRIYPYEKVKLIAEYQKLDHGASVVAYGAAISF